MCRSRRSWRPPGSTRTAASIATSSVARRPCCSAWTSDSAAGAAAQDVWGSARLALGRLALGLCGGDRHGRCLGQAGDREAATDEELANLLEGQAAARAVPVPDAVVEPEDGARQQTWIGLRDRALFHPA